MTYTIVGIRETGELASYGRSESKPSLEDAEVICHNFEYSQLLVLENKVSGYVQRYEYDREPRIRAVPMRRKDGEGA